MLFAIHRRKAKSNAGIRRCEEPLLLGRPFLQGEPEAAIAEFVGYHNHRRYHVSLRNLTPADVYSGYGQTILLEREKTKRRTFEKRRLHHARTAA